MAPSRKARPGWLDAALPMLVAAAAAAQWLGRDDAGLWRLVLRFAPSAATASHAVALADWLLMCTAMMLPTAWPLLRGVARLGQQTPKPHSLPLVSSAGILAVWLAAGVVWRAVGSVATVAFEGQSVVRASQMAALLAVLCGIYLLSPWAERCARSCRTPTGHIARHWTGRPDVLGQSWRIGLSYGLSCVGCCWPLMVTMGLVGWASVGAMMGLTLLMVAQKSPRLGPIVTRVSGVLLVLLGLALWTGHWPWTDARGNAWLDICVTR